MCLCALTLGACAYRIATPYQISGGIAVNIDGNQAKLVRSQLSMHRSVTTAIQRDLAWPIRKTSMNTLSIDILDDQMEESSRDALRISNRWIMTFHCMVKFTSPYLQSGDISKKFSARAAVSSLADEVNAIERASDNMADQIRAWLEAQSYKD